MRGQILDHVYIYILKKKYIEYHHAFINCCCYYFNIVDQFHV